MMNSSDKKHVVLQAGMALSLSILTLAGCKSPTAVSGLGGTPNGTAGNLTAGAYDQAAEHYVASPVNQTIASVTASINATNAKNAVDNNTSSCWDSQTATKPTFRVVLASRIEMTSLELKLNPNVGTYTVEVSDDAQSWKGVLWNQTNSSWNVESKKFPAGTMGKYVRLTFNNYGKKIMLFEVDVKGGASTTTATPAPTTATPAPTATATPAPTTTTPTGTGINVYTGSVLWKATSHVLATCRNHVTSDFPNGDAKITKMKELTPTWGERKYLYRIGHGPTDGRNDYSYMTGFHFEQTWDKTGGYPYDDVRNALKEANALGADQMHVINFGTSNADEAARYVSFLNHAGDANRAKHPIAQQNVRMFELGNEISWSMVRGHDTYAPNETAYATRAKDFATKMRAASDVPIQIGAVASTNSNWMGNGWSGGATTVKNILTTMGNQVDFLIFHGYPSWPVFKDGNLLTFIAQNEWSKQKLESEIRPAIKQYAGGRDVYIANTEFFSNLYNDPTRSRGMFGALYSADSITLAMNEDIRTAVEFCFDHKDMADSAFFIGNDPNNVTAIFKLQRMLAKHWGDNIVKTDSSGIPAVAVTGASTSINMPRLSFTAATSGTKVYVMVTNRTNDQAVKTNVNVGFKPSSVTAYELSGTYDSANGNEATISNPSLTGYTFKPASVTIFEISR